LEFVGTWSTSGPDANRRRSQRVILSVPVSVSGQGQKGQFTEETKTLVVNAHGALITLAAKVSQGQQLELKSVSNPEKQTCKVVYIGPTVQGQTQVGIEFTKPAPHFWHVAFPPENWTPVADEGAGGKAPTAAPTKPGVTAGPKPPVTAPAKGSATSPAKPPVTAPVKASKP
jgi:PilZ domain